VSLGLERPYFCARELAELPGAALPAANSTVPEKPPEVMTSNTPIPGGPMVMTTGRFCLHDDDPWLVLGDAIGLGSTGGALLIVAGGRCVRLRGVGGVVFGKAQASRSR